MSRLGFRVWGSGFRGATVQPACQFIWRGGLFETSFSRGTDYNHIVMGGWKNDTPRKQIEQDMAASIRMWEPHRSDWTGHCLGILRRRGFSTFSHATEVLFLLRPATPGTRPIRPQSKGRGTVPPALKTCWSNKSPNCRFATMTLAGLGR